MQALRKTELPSFIMVWIAIAIIWGFVSFLLLGLIGLK
jgi:hypothetical protein